MEYFDVEYRVLEIYDMRAKGLKNVNTITITDMDVYVTGLISGDSRTVRWTPTDSGGGGSTPVWNHRMKFSVAEDDVATPNDHFVRFDLRSKRPILGDRDIGYVSVRLHHLLKKAVGDGGERHMTEKIYDPSGKKTEATLTFSYRFDERFCAPPPQKICGSSNGGGLPPGVAPPRFLAKLYVFTAEEEAITYGRVKMEKAEEEEAVTNGRVKMEKNKGFKCLGTFAS